ncbi:hydrolase 76 protein [Geranomyces variabilis]|nr:hydrolase 76 protein [Geranomyces variabilis]
MLLLRPALVLLSAAIGSAAAALTLDPNDSAALGAAAHQATYNIVNLYSTQLAAGKTSDGGFDQSAVSWFASGIIWSQVFGNSVVTKDRSMDSVAATAMTAATYGTSADLLGGALKTINEKLKGRWNDDMGWWAIGMLSAVDAYGKDAQMPGGGKFLDVAALTFNEMYEQWDTQCGGGIYWSRDRSPTQKDADYKSTISNSQFVEMGARLAMLTGNQTYLDMASQTYQWIKVSGVMTAQFVVTDGVHTASCGTVNPTALGYNQGVMISALAYMYKATKVQSYLDDAKALVNAAVPVYAPNNIVTEPRCPVGSCGRETPMGKPQFVKGLSDLYTVTTDAAVKTTIQTVIDTTLASALKNCDANWWCSQDWTNVRAPAQNDPYDQYGTTELLVAAARVHGATAPAGTTAGNLGTAPAGGDAAAAPAAGGSTAPASTAAAPKKNSAISTSGAVSILGSIAVGVLAAGLANFA